ncbi:MAG: 23S rRNA (uracil(1939)-C(5))-methyltransferase RlmD [Eubacteriales bacterium]|nr:23S rRNA (uracil(1939)-C(5))-methyltransferase RlmD [Eubacteriales bacterium]
MKKGQVLEGRIREVVFPNKGIAEIENEERTVIVKNALPGQKVRVSINKIRKGKAEGRLLEVLEKSSVEIEPPCPHFADCGGCTYQNLPYEEQLAMKEAQVRKLLKDYCTEKQFEKIHPSPLQFGYRNKMEFSFGDEYKDGPLSLGMHKRGSFYDIVTVDQCQIVDEDFRAILTCVKKYFDELGVDFYHKLQHKGYLRHLLVRKAVRTGDILVDLVTSSQTEYLGEREEKSVLQEMTEKLTALSFKGRLTGVLHTVNDSLADVIQNDRTDILYGQDYFFEELLGLKFKISPFSFFQTNSLGAEVLYETARSYVGETKDKVIFDLYSGTGTIAQMLAPVAKKVIGIEIVEEAVEAAKVNAELNGLNNCEFIAGDVLKAIDLVGDTPDFIVLDPPRDGVNPKALQKIINFGVEKMLYISCKPTSLARDLELLEANGYQIEKVTCVDMFPGTYHTETICALSRIK